MNNPTRFSDGLDVLNRIQSIMDRTMGSLILLVVVLAMSGATMRSPATIHKYQVTMGEPIFKEMAWMIDQADEEVQVGMYLIAGLRTRFVPTVLDALVEAKNRGVDVTVTMDQPKYNAEAFRYLKQRGIDVQIYRNRNKHHSVHVKGLVIDEEAGFLGSHNLTSTAVSGVNFEAGVFFESKQVAEALRRYLEGLRTRPEIPESWKTQTNKKGSAA